MNLAAIRLPKLWLGVLTVLDKNFHISLLLNQAVDIREKKFGLMVSPSRLMPE